jgi:hypothetical protein
MNMTISPAFERLANINMNTSLSPAFERLASINLGSSLNPAFERLANLGDLNKLSSRIDSLIAKAPVNVLNIPVNTKLSVPANFKALNIASRKNIALQFAAPDTLYKLSFTPSELSNAKLSDIAQIVQPELYLINPERIILGPASSYEVAPQNVSIQSLLAVEAK